MFARVRIRRYEHGVLRVIVKEFCIALISIGLMWLGLTMATPQNATPVLSLWRTVVSIALISILIAALAFTDAVSSIRHHQWLLGIHVGVLLALAIVLAVGVVRDGGRMRRSKDHR